MIAGLRPSTEELGQQPIDERIEILSPLSILMDFKQVRNA